MPRGDRTGPEGTGPMSGRRAGYCTGLDMPGFANHAFGRNSRTGSGRNRGRGPGGRHGSRHMFLATGLPGWMRRGNYIGFNQKTEPVLEKQSLKYQENILQSQLDLVRKRLSELDSPDSVVD